MGIYLNGISQFKFNIKRDLKILINNYETFSKKIIYLCYNEYEIFM